MSGPFKLTLLELLGELTVYKKHVNVISSNILRDVVGEKLWSIVVEHTSLVW